MAWHVARSCSNRKAEEGGRLVTCRRCKGTVWAAHLDSEYGLDVLDHSEGLAGSPSAHGNVILLTGRRRYRINRGRATERLVLGHQRSCRAMRDHEASAE